jgi:hypothetical protein
MQDGSRTDRAAGGWRDRFICLDRLPSDAPKQERQARGREFEQILNGMLTEAGLTPRTSFRPNGEEIDGSFLHRDRVLLLEAKWTRDRLPASSIYQFRGKVEGKLVGTIGVFISMGGFSPDAVDALVAGKMINTILFDGDDIRAVAAGQADFPGALDQKLRAAAETGTPYVPLRDPVSRQPYDISARAGRPSPTLVVADVLGPVAGQLEVIPAGGVFNLAVLADAMRAAAETSRVVIIADGDDQAQSVRRRIEAGLDADGPGTPSQTEILVFDPTFEDALGIRVGFAERRQRMLDRDRRYLQERVRAAGIRQLAERDSQVLTLLRALGLT